MCVSDQQRQKRNIAMENTRNIPVKNSTYKNVEITDYVNFINITLVNNDRAFLCINSKHTFSFYSVEWFIMKYLHFSVVCL